MEYNEIVTAYKNNKIDISEIKKDIEISSSLHGRNRFRTVELSAKNNDFMTNVVNMQRIAETPEKSEEFEELLDKVLYEYYSNLIISIKENRAWRFMKLNPQEYTIEKFEELNNEKRFEEISKLNRKYSKYLQFQKIADIRDYIKDSGNLNENDIRKLIFLKLMFNNLDNEKMKKEFFCFDKKFLTTLINYKKSKIKKLEDFMKTKGKEIAEDYDRYSVFFSTEDFRDIIENLILTKKTLKVSLIYVIEAYYELSESEAEENYINCEYEELKELEEKALKMNVLGKVYKKKKDMQLQEKKKIEEKESKLIELQQRQEELERRKKEIQEKIKKRKKEEKKKKEEQEKLLKEEAAKENIKEQVNPLIFSWFEREDITLTRRVGSKNLTAFFEKIKKIETETGVRVSLFLVTNAGKEVTKKRLQEFQKKSRTNGLPKLVDGALGGYSSFRVDENGNIIDISIMSEENRNKIIKLLERPVRFYLPKDIIEEDEKEYLRYQFTSKKDSSINQKFLTNCISKILEDEKIKKQPLQFVPYIEKDLAGIDVLLSSQLEGLNQLSNYYKTKYQIAPGRTLRVNIDLVKEFIEGENIGSSD